MRVRHLAVSITAMAVMSAFGSAFAQTSTQQSGSSQQSSSTDVQVNPNTTIDARGRSSVNVGEVSGSASTTQDSSINQRSQSSTSSSQSGSASSGATGSTPSSGARSQGSA